MNSSVLNNFMYNPASEVHRIIGAIEHFHQCKTAAKGAGAPMVSYTFPILERNDQREIPYWVELPGMQVKSTPLDANGMRLAPIRVPRLVVTAPWSFTDDELEVPHQGIILEGALILVARPDSGHYDYPTIIVLESGRRQVEIQDGDYDDYPLNPILNALGVQV